MKIGIFTGTFDPFTIGHQNIAERALPMFDKLVIAVAVSKLKHASEEISKRVEDIKAVFPKECSELVDAEDASKGYRLEVVSYDDLTIDLAHRMGARFLVRGVRSAKDFEYEREQADINKQLGGVETILLFSDPRYSSISSTLVRELRFFGREVDEFLPKIKKNRRKKRMITYNVDGVKMPKIKKRDTSAWIRKVAASHGRKVGEIGYMFVDDEKILEVNNEYLGHDYYTDVITFDYDEDDVINGDIVISLDTVRTNAEQFGKTYDDELHRVIIHGILHLCGINDKGPGEREIMEENENKALALLEGASILKK